MYFSTIYLYFLGMDDYNSVEEIICQYSLACKTNFKSLYIKQQNVFNISKGKIYPLAFHQQCSTLHISIVYFKIYSPVICACHLKFHFTLLLFSSYQILRSIFSYSNNNYYLQANWQSPNIPLEPKLSLTQIFPLSVICRGCWRVYDGFSFLQINYIINILIINIVYNY